MHTCLRKLVASVLIVLFLSLPGAMLAQEKRGADLVVAKKDGSSVAGELIAVKQDSLVLLSPVGKDESVAVGDISTITIVKRSKAGKGFVTGLLVGGITGGVLFAAAGENASLHGGEGIFFGVLVFGGLFGMVGLGLGALASSDQTLEFGGLTETEQGKVLQRLRGMARMPSAQ